MVKHRGQSRKSIFERLVSPLSNMLRRSRDISTPQPNTEERAVNPVADSSQSVDSGEQLTSIKLDAQENSVEKLLYTDSSSDEDAVNIDNESNTDTGGMDTPIVTNEAISSIDSQEDDDEWDDVFGFTDDESDWDYSPSWDGKQSEKSGSSSIIEWSQSLGGLYGDVISCLLDGMTEAQTANKCGITVGSVKSLLSYCLLRKPVVREDRYVYAYETYSLSLEEFIDIFGRPAREYRYLCLAYKKGSRETANMLEDANIPESAKNNLRHRIDRINSRTNHVEISKTDVIHDNVRAEEDTVRVEVDTNSSQQAYRRPSYSSVISDVGVLKTEPPKINTNQSTIPAADEEVSNDEEPLDSRYEGLLAALAAAYGEKEPSTHAHRKPGSRSEQAKSAKTISASNVRPNTVVVRNNTLHESTRSVADRLVKAVLALAKDNTEYSTNYFLRALPDIARDLGVDEHKGKTPERQFYDLFRKAFEKYENVSFPAGFYVCFGKADRQRQVFDLMVELSPVTAKDLRREYEKRYGVSQTSLYGVFRCISQYRRGEVYSITYKGKSSPPKRPMNTGMMGQPVINKPLVSASKPSLANSPTAIAHSRDSLEACPEDVPEITHTSNMATEITTNSADASTADKDRSGDIRNAIDKLAKNGYEYSTDYFYGALPDLVASLGSPSKMDFYFLVESAYKGFSNITFPMGHAICFGDCDRDEQMSRLMQELRTPDPERMAVEYEKRYGFNKFVVLRWYRGLAGRQAGRKKGRLSERKKGKTNTTITSNNDRVENPEAKELQSDSAIKATGSRSDLKSSEVPDDTNAAEGANTSKVIDSHSSAQEGKRLNTAIDWILSLEGQTRQIVQQIVFGNTLPRVAANAGINLKEASEIIISAIKNCPTVREDSYLITFNLYTSRWEFCEATKESEATYNFLYWRNRALNAGVADKPVESVKKGKRPLGPAAPARDVAAEERRKLREASRAEYRIERAGSSTTADHETLSGVGDGRNRLVVNNGTRSGSERTLARHSTNPSVKGVGTTRRRDSVYKRIARECDRVATLNKEYSSRYFFQELSDLMTECGVKSDKELFEILKAAYRFDIDVSFGEAGEIRYGRCDRKSQLESLLKESPFLDRESFIAEYSKRYGFEKTRIEQWIREFSIGFRKGSAYQASPAKKPHVGTSSSSTAAKASHKAMSAKSKTDISRERSTDAKDNRDISIQTVPKGNASRASLSKEYERFLRGELNSECCDRKLIVERFKARFPKGPSNPFSDSMLRRLGYQAKGKKLLFKDGVNYIDYFKKLIESQTMFARGDRGFENAVFNDPLFRKILREKMRAFEIVEYERDSFISTNHLCKQMDVTLDDIRGYSQDIVRQLRESQGLPVPFTIWSLENVYHTSHPLNKLVTEGGMSTYTFETLFDIDPKVQCCTISKKRGFLETDGAFDTGNFIECLIELNGPMEIDDLLDLLRNSYGIDYHELPLRHTISASSLYYDDITDSVFNSRLEWEEMVNRELA